MCVVWQIKGLVIVTTHPPASKENVAFLPYKTPASPNFSKCNLDAGNVTNLHLVYVSFPSEFSEIVCKEPKPVGDDRTEGKELLPCRTYDDMWIEFEDCCLERLSQYNPFVAIQSSLGNVLLFGQKHKAKVCCAVGIAICLKIATSYLMEYCEWTDGPRPMFT